MENDIIDINSPNRTTNSRIKLLASITLLTSVGFILININVALKLSQYPIFQKESYYSILVKLVFTIFLNILCIVGAFIMLKQRKSGFYIHAAGSGILAFLSIKSIFNLSNQINSIELKFLGEIIPLLIHVTVAACHVLFIYLYYHNSKKFD